MDWTAGYSARFALTLKNGDWTDGAAVPRIRSISIERDAEEDVPLLESCSVEVDVPAGSEAPSGWARIDMIASQGGETAREALGCFRLEAAGTKTERSVTTATLDGSSVLKPADEAPLAAGTYAPRGADGAAWAAGMLSRCPGPVVAEGSFEVSENVVFGDDATALSAVWEVLDAHGWCLRLDGDGTVRIMPLPSEPELTATARDARGIGSASESRDGARSYERAWAPGARPLSIARLRLPALSLDADYRITKQSLSIGPGVSVTETAREVPWAR